MIEPVYRALELWLDKLLAAKLPARVAAYCFNLYDCDDEFDVQLVGAPSYSEEDDDWACDTVYSSEEDVFTFKADGWQKALDICCDCIRCYLSQGSGAEKLKSGRAVAVGFVDGDLVTVYKR